MKTAIAGLAGALVGLTAAAALWLLGLPLETAVLTALVPGAAAAVLTGIFSARAGEAMVGASLFLEGKYEQARPFLHKAATTGNDVASSKLLGDMHFHGLGAEPDWERAASWYNSVLAMDSAVAAAIKRGRELMRDEKPCFTSPTGDLAQECAARMAEIADADNALACRALGNWYSLTPGRVDRVKVAEYYRRAAALGDAEADDFYNALIAEDAHDADAGAPTKRKPE